MWKVKVAQSCPTLCDPMDCSAWNSLGQNTGVGTFPFSRGSSQPRDRTQVSRIGGGFFTGWATGKSYVEFALYLKASIRHLLCTCYVPCEQSDVVPAGWWQGAATGWWSCCQLSLSKSKSPRAQVQHAPQPWFFSERKSPISVDSAIHLYSFEPMAYLSPYISFRHQTPYFNRLQVLGCSTWRIPWILVWWWK